MKAWIVLSTMMVLAACGRPDGPRPSQPAASPAALTGAEPADLVCTGQATDGTDTFRVLAYRGKAEHYERVVVEDVSEPDAPRTLETLETYRDITPPPPTDIEFRLVFGDDAGFAVMLTHGGYTQQSTSELKQAKAVLAWQTCRRPE